MMSKGGVMYNQNTIRTRERKEFNIPFSGHPDSENDIVGRSEV